MKIYPLDDCHIADAVSLWNEAVARQKEGYQRFLLEADHLRKIMSDPNYLPDGSLVGVEPGSLSGFILGYIQRTNPRGDGDVSSMPARIAGIAVRPECWGRGVGRSLLNAAEEAFKAHGKFEAAFETYRQPLSLVRGPYLDSGPYRFFTSCGYSPCSHEVVLRNELDNFRMSDDVRKILDELNKSGVEFRPPMGGEYEGLMRFMGRHFSGGWHLAIKRAVEDGRGEDLIIALNRGRISGFIGPFKVDKDGGYGSFGSPGVSPDDRGRGIGKVLINLGLEKLKDNGAGYAEYPTGAGPDNPARHIYLSAGARFEAVFCKKLHKRLG